MFPDCQFFLFFTHVLVYILLFLSLLCHCSKVLICMYVCYVLFNKYSILNTHNPIHVHKQRVVHHLSPTRCLAGNSRRPLNVGSIMSPDQMSWNRLVFVHCCCCCCCHANDREVTAGQSSVVELTELGVTGTQRLRVCILSACRVYRSGWLPGSAGVQGRARTERISRTGRERRADGCGRTDRGARLQRIARLSRSARRYRTSRQVTLPRSGGSKGGGR